MILAVPVMEAQEAYELPLMMIQTNGQTIGPGERIVAEMGLMDYSSSGRSNLLTDSFNVYNGRIFIKIRGSSSQLFPKKNYNFETQDDSGANYNVPLLGLPEENDWVLHGPYTDKTLIRNVLSYHIASATGSYAPRTRWIELWINNDYSGVYVLSEKIKQDDHRVNIAELDPDDTDGDQLTGGYIIQIDRNDPEPGDGWYSAYRNVFYAYHDPGYDQLVPEQKAYIRDFVSGFEDAVKSAADESDFLPFIDINSFADYWIPTEICKHVDGYKLSFYMYKEIDSRGGRLHLGPVWDLDLAYGNSDFGDEPVPQGWSWTKCETSSIRPFWITDLMATEPIRNAIACKWKGLRAGALNTDSLIHYIDDNLETIREARMRNFERWPVLGIYVWPNYYVGTDYGDDVEFLKTWLTLRLPQSLHRPHHLRF
ncbi:MAG: CotH kinase family protein [Bacteroidota bacterium]